MPKPQTDALELTYPLRTVVRLTGLSPEVLRAWERRHNAIEPLRTEGGTRRYRAADVERLKLLKTAVDGGQRIGQIAGLDDDALRRQAAPVDDRARDQIEAILTALDQLEVSTAQRLLAVQLSTLGPAAFGRDVALPLVQELGQRWADGTMSIASEHLGTAILRSLLGSSLQPTASSTLGPRIVFATPSGERHEIGLLMAALTALSAGGNPIYLGLEMPAEDLLAAVAETDAVALAVSLVTIPEAQAARTLGALRGGLPEDTFLWVGGAAAATIALPAGTEHLGTLEELEQRVGLLVLDNPQGR